MVSTGSFQLNKVPVLRLAGPGGLCAYKHELPSFSACRELAHQTTVWRRFLELSGAGAEGVMAMPWSSPVPFMQPELLVFSNTFLDPDGSGGPAGKLETTVRHAYAALSQRCLARDPAARPTFGDIQQTLCRWLIAVRCVHVHGCMGSAVGHGSEHRCA